MPADLRTYAGNTWRAASLHESVPGYPWVWIVNTGWPKDQRRIPVAGWLSWPVAP